MLQRIGLELKDQFSHQSYYWVRIQLNPNPIGCVVSIPNGLIFCPINFYMSVFPNIFICIYLTRTSTVGGGDVKA